MPATEAGGRRCGTHGSDAPASASRRGPPALARGPSSDCRLRQSRAAAAARPLGALMHAGRALGAHDRWQPPDLAGEIHLLGPASEGQCPAQGDVAAVAVRRPVKRARRAGPRGRAPGPPAAFEAKVGAGRGGAAITVPVIIATSRCAAETRLRSWSQPGLVRTSPSRNRGTSSERRHRGRVGRGICCVKGTGSPPRASPRSRKADPRSRRALLYSKHAMPRRARVGACGSRLCAGSGAGLWRARWPRCREPPGPRGARTAAFRIGRAAARMFANRFLHFGMKSPRFAHRGRLF